MSKNSQDVLTLCRCALGQVLYESLSVWLSLVGSLVYRTAPLQFFEGVMGVIEAPGKTKKAKARGFHFANEAMVS